MVSDVVAVESRGGYRLWLPFQDGVEGEVDHGPDLTVEGVFASLRDPAGRPYLGTICWPNGADWDPLVLYSLVTRQSIESLLTRSPDASA